MGEGVVETSGRWRFLYRIKKHGDKGNVKHLANTADAQGNNDDTRP